jgi:hypothetical protein
MFITVKVSNLVLSVISVGIMHEICKEMQAEVVYDSAQPYLQGECLYKKRFISAVQDLYLK